MRDDQADEITVMSYMKETNASEKELWDKGLMRSGAKSKRGAFIAIYGSEDLQNRVRNKAIKPIKAELICRLTKDLKDKSIVEGIQAECVKAFEAGESEEFVAGLVQALAAGAAEGASVSKQMSFDFGVDFAEEARRIAKFIERGMKDVNAAISIIKGRQSLKGERRSMAEEMGYDVRTPEGEAEMLSDLMALKAKFEHAASNPELMQAARSWDGESKIPNAAREYLAQAKAERERAQREKEMDAAQYVLFGGENESSLDGAGTSFSMVSRRLYKELQGAFTQMPDKKSGKKVWVKKAKTKSMFVVCPDPDILNRVIPWNRNVVVKAEIAKKLLNKHHFTMHDVARLPHALNDPIAVFEENPRSLVIITDIRTQNDKGETKNALAVLELRMDDDAVKITEVKTAYAADKQSKYAHLLNGNRLRYADKARAQQWAKEEGSSIFQLLTTSLAEPGSKVMLKENMPDVNYNLSDGVSFSLTDGRQVSRLVQGRPDGGWQRHHHGAFLLDNRAARKPAHVQVV